MRAFEFLTENPQIKSRVITRLQKTPSDSPIFPEVYKTLVGEPLTGRIRNYIEARGDADAKAAVDYLDKLIPTLGTTEEVKAFMAKFTRKPDQKTAYDFIKLNVAFPKDGMAAPAPLSDIVDDGFAKKLFDKLIDYKGGKNDAGPGEAAMAIMSPNITYAQGATVDEYGRGGDLIVAGVGKVEVKGGGGGRLIPFKAIDQKGMSQALANYGMAKAETKKSIAPKAKYEKLLAKSKETGEPPPTPPKEEGPKKMAGITPSFMAGALPTDFPKEQFLRAAAQAWFNGAYADELVAAAGSEEFLKVWLNACYNGYKEFAGWQGVLFLSSGAYQYTVSGSQILGNNSTIKWGYIYYPGTSQPREMAPQVIPNAS